MSKNRHGKKLRPSTLDDIQLAYAVETRFLDLCGTYLRVRGVEIPIPSSLNADLLRWREMRVRHNKGDYRNSEAEKKSVRTVAQWTVTENCELRGQENKIVEWGDG